MADLKTIDIEGATYVQVAQTPLTDEAKELLNAVYCRVWAEAYYHPYNERTQEFAKPLADHMSRLNEILRFKR